MMMLMDQAVHICTDADAGANFNQISSMTQLAPAQRLTLGNLWILSHGLKAILIVFTY